MRYLPGTRPDSSSACTRSQTGELSLMAVPSSLPPGLALSQAASTPSVAYVNLKAILETYVVSMSGFEEPAPLYCTARLQNMPECWGRAYMYMYIHIHVHVLGFVFHAYAQEIGGRDSNNTDMITVQCHPVTCRWHSMGRTHVLASWKAWV